MSNGDSKNKTDKFLPIGIDEKGRILFVDQLNTTYDEDLNESGKFKCCFCGHEKLILDQDNDCYLCESCEFEFCTTEQMNRHIRKFIDEQAAVKKASIPPRESEIKFEEQIKHLR